MKKVVTAIIKAGSALLFLALAVNQPALADCPPGSNPLIFGNLGGGALSIDQRGGDFAVHTYIYQSPAINNGGAPTDVWAFDGGLVGGIEGTTVVFGDWSAGVGFAGCPYSLEAVTLNQDVADENVNQVFVGRDSGGVVVIVAKAGTGLDFPRDINFDGAAGTEGFAKSSLKPTITSATVSGTLVTVDLMWDPLAVNVDARSTGITDLVGSYGILLRRSGGATEQLTDMDGVNTDNRARVSIQQDAAGSGSTGNLFVVANLIGSGGAPGPSAMGAASSDILLTPGLATPGRGKGKGLEKAPGQNR